MRETSHESLKEELIKTILSTIHKNKDNEEQLKQKKYLEMLSEDELDEILRNYYAYNIKKKE